RKQLEFEKAKLEMEQKALRAQMNPHFIFNAINSIQSYILKKSEQEAYDYLAKFSRLIRIVLNNSQEKSLMLHQELEMIKLYVEMEQLRFNNKFEFNLTINDDVHPYEMFVPAMLIQPYIENAIWHGLMNLENERHGMLNLNLSMNDTLLKIIIEDNGIGREKSKLYKKEDRHKPVGMQLTEERLLMINKMEEFENAKVIITDIRDDKGQASGTRVEIFIPVNV
ncbi:MAG: histidine kinase, partial [Crocinitomicaceae bacterium]|nr:histidine kinase [Crocinitomicaceae bacterium]